LMLGPKDPFEKAKWRAAKGFRLLVYILGGTKIVASFFSSLQSVSIKSTEFVANVLFNASSDALIFGGLLVAAWMFSLWCNLSYRKHVDRR
jgi:hypothetical protein